MAANRSRLPAVLVALVLLCQAASAGTQDLASRIDARLEARWKADRVKPAPAADDAEFLRRLYLDLHGRIPRAADVHEFLADARADKRGRWIDRLLAEPRFALHFANVWRAELMPEAASDPAAAALRPGFENWLAGQFRAGVRYDRMVRGLLTTPVGGGKDGEPVLRSPTRPNPLAFFAAKGARPENIASAVSRSFMGIRLECAQCHDHPFARWTQGQFWGQAAFFAGLTKQGPGTFAPLVEVVGRRELTPPGKQKPRQAEFLVGGRPAWKGDRPARAILAEWITAPENPFFARAAVNRVWRHFFGQGLVEPVDDFRDDNPPADPELLDELSRAFVRSGFDLPFLIRSVCGSRAYQRTSARTDASQDRARPAARMLLKALTGEQLFDSLALATGYHPGLDRGASRRQFLTRFAREGSAGEPETSVQQALTLLNGRFTAWATDPERCPTLVAVTGTPGMSTAQQVESLYLATLGRKPTSAEQDRLGLYVRKVKPGRGAERLADVFWMLLNSAEFRMNH
jgi:hypothetical protein